MINSISSQQQLQQLQFSQQSDKVNGHHGHHKSPQSMFDNLNKAVGGDGTGITQDQLKAAADKAQSDGNTKESKMLNKILSDFNKLSGGADKITVNSLQQALPVQQAQSSSQTAQTTKTSGKAGCDPCSGCGRCNNGSQQTPDSVTKAQLQTPINLNIV